MCILNYHCACIMFCALLSCGLEKKIMQGMVAEKEAEENQGNGRTTSHIRLV